MTEFIAAIAVFFACSQMASASGLSITLDVIIPQKSEAKPAEVKDEISLAQRIWQQCDIQISVNKISRPVLDDTLVNDYETLEFHNGEIPSQEKMFFAEYRQSFPVILFVNFLDWSYDPDGRRAISYPWFLLKHENYLKQANEKEFYAKKMAGSVIIGKFREPSTLAHEFGHGLFNLRHSSEDGNLMIGTVSGQRTSYKLNARQCETARKSALRFIHQ